MYFGVFLKILIIARGKKVYYIVPEKCTESYVKFYEIVGYLDDRVILAIKSLVFFGMKRGLRRQRG